MFLGFDSNVTDAADDVVGDGLALFHSHDLDGIRLIMRAQNQVTAGGFDVLDGATLILEDGVHVELAFAIRLERVVMTVDQECGTGQEARVHTHAFAAIDFDYHKALPLLAIAFGFGFELLEEAFFELENLLDVHAGDEGLGGSDTGVDDEDILELVVAGRHNRSAFVDLRGIEEIEHGKMLNGEDPVHALEAQAPLAIEEIGDVGLLEAGLFCQTKAGKVALLNALPESFAEVVLQHSEFHGLKYSTCIIAIR